MDNASKARQVHRERHRAVERSIGTARVPGCSERRSLRRAEHPWCAGSIALHGANCQRFAYAVIRHYGCEIADFRSSELWADEVFTQHVNEIEPLDLLFFNREAETYGAHVGVYMGAGLVAHLAKHVGTPTLWTLADFAARREYANVIGAKRPIRRAAQPSKTVGSV
jgi:cell wall-associated NlpC family hydrolase